MSTSEEEASQVSSKAPGGQGQMIDVGGHQLYFQSHGEGSPVVIIESGLGGTSTALHWLIQGIAKFTRVCTYDRSGLGKSEAGSKPFDFLDTVSHLHILLEKAGVKGPYILVGHSIGGILIRGFTQKYPEEVAGLVFLDSSHPEQFDQLPKFMVMQSKIIVALLKFRPLGNFLLKKAIFNEVGQLPPEVEAEFRKEMSSPRHYKAMLAEYGGVDSLFSRTRGYGSLGDRPVTVFSANMPKSKVIPLLHKLHRKLAALSTKGTHRIVEGATHINIIAKRENALVIVDEVRRMVEEIRAGTNSTSQE